MFAEDVITFWREVQSITKLPLSNPAALYIWLSKSDMDNYIKVDNELRQLANFIKEHINCKSGAELARRLTAFADRRLLAATMPNMASYLESLASSRRTTDQTGSKKWTSALAYAFQTIVSILGILRSG